MKQVKLEFVLRAQQPIAHHSESFGNQTIIARRKVRMPDGAWVHVPVVSGDAIRHGMREASSYAYLDAAGLLHEGGFSEPALRLLFSGGVVTGPSGGVSKLNDYREMCELVPTLGLFGGCAQNRPIPGRLWVDDAVLICAEMAHLLPERVLDVARVDGADLETCRTHVEVVQRVRMDPVLDPGKRNLLSASARLEIERRLLASENASALGDAVAKERAKSSMMPRSFERVAQGSLFYWSVTATVYDALDDDTFKVACAAFLADARVGGKRGTGHGLLAPVTGWNVHLARPIETTELLQPDTLSTGRVGSLFRSHVSERQERIRSFLHEVVA